jgi:hypothetical protein
MTPRKPLPQNTFHVSPDGNDRNPGTAKRPFATLGRARDAVRGINRKMSGDIVVLLHGGTYPVEKTLVFGPEDSGCNGHDVAYCAAPSDTPVLSGGRRVSGWQPGPDGIWTAALDVRGLRQLYVEGRRARRAAIPAPAGLEESGNLGYRTQNDAVAGWSHPEDIEFVYTDMWVYTYVKVVSIVRSGQFVEVRLQQPYYTLGYAKEGRYLQGCYPRTVENSLSFLREPGQWYFDRHTKVLHYKPLPGEDPAKAEVIVPVTERLLDVRGTLDQPVRNLRFEGLTFADASWLKPSETGLIDLQSNFTLGPETRLFARVIPGNESNSSCLFPYHSECTKGPANVVCHAAHAIRFERCTFIRLGGAGLDIEHGSQDNVVDRCQFTDIAGTAIQVGDIQAADHHPSDPRLVVRNNAIRDCRFQRCAQDYRDGHGVFVGYTDATVIEHCEFRDLPYSAIAMGWGWGEVDAGGGNYVHPDLFDTPTPCANNRIENNHIHDVMMELWDGGGIYTLGEMPGTVIRGNHLHDTRGWPGGIYLDEGSGHIEVCDNVVYRTPTNSPRYHLGCRPLNFNNRAQNRLASCPVHDNHTDGPDAPDFPKAIVERAGPRARTRG